MKHFVLTFVVCLNFAVSALTPSWAQVGEQPPGPPLEVTVIANAPPGGPGDKLWRMFDASVTAQSNGRIDLSLLVHGQLGGDDLLIQALRRNRGQIGIVAESGFSRIVPEIAVLNMPYLFDGPEELDFVVDGYVTPLITAMAAERGIEFLQWVEIGWMNLYAKQALLVPGDAKSYSLRSLPYETSQAFLTAIGADVVNLSFPDVIPGLQTGLINGGESSTLMYARAGLYQEAPHLTLTRHAYSFGALLANKDWLDDLAPADRAIITTAFPDQTFIRTDTRQSLVLELDAAEKEGVFVHRLDAGAVKSWADLARATHTGLIARIGGDAQRVYDLVQEGKAAFVDQSQ